MSAPRPQSMLGPTVGRRTRGRWIAYACAAWAVACSGCAPAVYTTHVLPASRLVAEAEQAGAAERAPYEYYYARAHLEQARVVASEAAYQDAIRYAKTAAEYGRRAQRQMSERPRSRE
ncbi:MAG: DUF4398 domain-containing protein [Myxococcales bacterium]|nr:DUF4398 domain-containing protein [Myxococcales bacterium]